MFDGLFDTQTVPEARVHTYGAVTLRVLSVSRENQHIDKFVPLVVWHAAEEACAALAGDYAHLVQGKTVIELGAGTGLAGLVAAVVSGADCLLTDGDASSVDAASESVRLNGLQARVRTAQLQWGDVAAARAVVMGRRFQVALATDVIYDRDAIAPLLTTASAVLEPGGRFVFFNHKFRFARLESEVRHALDSVPGLALAETMKLGDVDVFIIDRCA